MTEKDVILDSSPDDTEVENSTESSDNEVQEALAAVEAKKPEEEKGSKTPPENLYKALDEEREKRQAQAKEIEELRGQIKEISSNSSELDDGGSKEVAELRDKIKSLEEAREIDSIITKYPQLSEKRAEFENFRKDFPGKLENVAKVFLVDNDLYETTPKRKGLERKTGGTSKGSPSITLADVKKLRENNYSKYTELLIAGKLDHIKE